MAEQLERTKIAELTTELVAAYVSYPQALLYSRPAATRFRPFSSLCACW
jgi:hypothetical protein